LVKTKNKVFGGNGVGENASPAEGAGTVFSPQTIKNHPGMVVEQRTGGAAWGHKLDPLAWSASRGAYLNTQVEWKAALKWLDEVNPA
jgi:hypothetical protein